MSVNLSDDSLERILGFLEEHPFPITAFQLSVIIGTGGKHAGEILGLLARQGHLVKKELSKKAKRKC